MNEAQIREILEGRFDPSQMEKIVAFMEKEGGFSQECERMLADYFIWVKEAGKALADALKICEEEWEWNWSKQDPGVRGNRHAPDVGVMNYASILNLFCKIGIPLPDEYQRG